ncbi:peptidase inhibitor family I36 protein [Amycolatopsis sp. NPDC051373]|uniref:peptidase inhibitor family I36 protein n=1 Tax=Amycolatopsis sp. NPDC051373 TaxID=3155801 RepID=UPI00344E6280
MTPSAPQQKSSRARILTDSAHTAHEGQGADRAAVDGEDTLGNNGKRLFQGLAATAGAVALLMTVPSAASAAPVRNGICEVGEFCLYYGYDLSGSVSDFTTSIPNYGSSQPGCYEFKSDGVGQHQCVKNNALSAFNQTKHVVKVYYNSNYGGISVTFQPGEARDGGLGPLDRENASHKFF